ncbi:hypothetical protein PPTG_24964 [Phytophthora nicotianae INRA-310]|uniref:Uncharacterized protein n=1 Tax=Phytophthora nicotianae (strain INRA-310) TaxID=761204 RepID=W2P8S7_PHYN3|nr:hypothetical protein PPTG_24964 [Phytophthora nicotianae INRA-310]ETM97412.1 hypothetical protein PPTG_24964 [Phytophthora nicotianae INRA-310]
MEVNIYRAPYTKTQSPEEIRYCLPKALCYECIAGIKLYRQSFAGDRKSGRIGMCIKKMGAFAEKDLMAMRDWHDEFPKSSALKDLAEWIRVSRFVRISLPSPLSYCATVNMEASAKKGDGRH